MLKGKVNRCTLKEPEFVLAREFSKRNDRAAEGDGTNGRTQKELQSVALRNGVTLVVNNLKGQRLCNCCYGNENSGQTNHAVHEGHQLGHFGHLNTLRHDRTQGAANQKPQEHVT